ncbi:MAG: hypothetical protein MHMPM18_001676 [Marteilia pararefringens]
MPSKRRLNGRHTNFQRGNCSNVRCSNCKSCVHKDKAIKVLNMKPLLNSGAKQDFLKAEAPSDVRNTRIIVLKTYCMSCARATRVVTTSALRIPTSSGRRILWEKCQKRLQEKRRSCSVALAANSTKESDKLETQNVSRKFTSSVSSSVREAVSRKQRAESQNAAPISTTQAVAT